MSDDIRMLTAQMKHLIQDLKIVCFNYFENSYYVGENEGVFRSHFDWHSSVHAHWMLLSSARLIGDHVTIEKLLERLNQNALDCEQQRLRQYQTFELPYGQAWLLLLFHELDQHEDCKIKIDSFRTETVERILNWLEKTEFPQKDNNSYHSWLITYFLLKKSKTTNFSDRICKLDLRFDLVSEVNDADDPKDFFSSESLFCLLKNISKPEVIIGTQLTTLEPITFKNCHVLGKFISQSWLIPESHARSSEVTFQFVQDFIQQSKFWKDDFHTVGHWIPQFLWFGIWLSLGEP